MQGLHPSQLDTQWPNLSRWQVATTSLPQAKSDGVLHIRLCALSLQTRIAEGVHRGNRTNSGFPLRWVIGAATRFLTVGRLDYSADLQFGIEHVCLDNVCDQVILDFLVLLVLKEFRHVSSCVFIWYSYAE